MPDTINTENLSLSLLLVAGGVAFHIEEIECLYDTIANRAIYLQ
jgi:hypothetical protein